MTVKRHIFVKHKLLFLQTMKKTLLSLFCGSVLVASSQELPMTLTAFNDTYVPLTDPINVNNGEIWDDPSYVVPIGFSFQIFNSPATELSFLGLGALVGSISPEQLVQGMWVYGSDIADAGNVSLETSMSPISYKVTGMSPNRIFKLEWSNVAFYNEVFDVGTANNKTNFQLWLYETSNVIEFRYGPNTITEPGIVHDFGFPYTGLINGLNLINGTAQGAWLLGGNPANPVPAFVNVATKPAPGPQHLLTSEPANGQVYRFAPPGTINVEEIAKANDFSVYPTQVSDRLMVRLDEGNTLDFVIRNLLGQEISTGRLNNGLNTLQLSNLTPGLYLFTANGNTVRFVKK